MQEVNTTEGASDDRIDGTTGTLNLDLCVTTNVGEDITLAELNEGQLTVVTVGKEICRQVSFV